MIELYQHQKVALSYLRSNNSFALFMEPGTGKTLVCLMRALDLINSQQISNVLVVAPKSALGAWQRDIEKFEPTDAEKLRNAITLINYESVWRRKQYDTRWDMIICDEAHALKNRTSKQASFLLKLSLKARYRYILTGTPISNGKLEDIWAQYCFLKPYEMRKKIYSQIFATPNSKGSYYDFLDRYCILNQFYQPYKYLRVNELQDIINAHSYKVKKVDCLDLPEKLPDEVIKVELKEKAIYKKMATASALIEYDIIADNPLSRMLKLRQIASGFITSDENLIELKSEKLNTLKEIIERYDDAKKLVIFAEFTHSIKAISKLLDGLKLKHVILNGEQKNKAIWREFQADASIRVIICQYKSANAGIDLFASDTIIYFEPTIKSDYLEQSRDRIHRRGQHNPCSYIHLITTGTIEVSIYNALAKFQDFNEKLFTEYMRTFSKGAR